MSGTSERKLLDTLRTMPRLEMDPDRQESVLRRLREAHVETGEGLVHAAGRSRRRQRVVRSYTAVSAAVVLAGAVVFQIHHLADGPSGQSRLSMKHPAASTPADSIQLTKLLGFQPLWPTYVPSGLGKPTASAGIGYGPSGKVVGRSYIIDYPYLANSRPKAADNLTGLDIGEEPLADAPLKDIKWHYIKVGDVQVMIEDQRKSRGPQVKQPIWRRLFREHDGMLYQVGGTQPLTELEKVLMSLSKPASGTPGQIDRSCAGANAGKILPWQVDFPSYLPSGFHQDLSNTFANYVVGPDREIQSNYGTEYKGIGGTIDITETYTKGVKNPQGVEKRAKPIRIDGHTVYLIESHTYINDQLMAPYDRFEWADPKTGVTFWVDGVSSTTQERMTKALMERVVASMLNK